MGPSQEPPERGVPTSPVLKRGGGPERPGDRLWITTQGGAEPRSKPAPPELVQCNRGFWGHGDRGSRASWHLTGTKDHT